MSDIDSEHGSARSRSQGAPESEAPESEAPSTDAEEFAAELEATFREDARRTARNLILLHLEADLRRQGKDRRHTSAVCGQLMRVHAQLSLPLLMARLAIRLTGSNRVTLDRQLQFLQDRWNNTLLPNDQTFIDAMGTRDDPAPDRLRQILCMMIQSEAQAAGLTTEDGQQMVHAINRYTRGFEYRRYAEFAMRSLSADGRKQFLVWIADFRQQHKSRASPPVAEEKKNSTS